jgi:hypothetical protein
MFKKGKSGNPNGRPKGSGAIKELNEIIKTVEKRKQKKLFTHFVNRAYQEDKVLVALMKKLVPDLRSVDIQGGGLDGDFTITVSRKKAQ